MKVCVIETAVRQMECSTAQGGSADTHETKQCALFKDADMEYGGSGRPYPRYTVSNFMGTDQRVHL